MMGERVKEKICKNEIYTWIVVVFGERSTQSRSESDGDSTHRSDPREVFFSCYGIGSFLFEELSSGNEVHGRMRHVSGERCLREPTTQIRNMGRVRVIPLSMNAPVAYTAIPSSPSPSNTSPISASSCVATMFSLGSIPMPFADAHCKRHRTDVPRPPRSGTGVTC